MSNYIYTCACCGTCWDCTSTGRKPAKAELAGMVCQPCREAPRRIAALEAENAELREDKARLDDMERLGITVAHRGGLPKSIKRWTAKRDNDSRAEAILSAADTPRVAIDAARKDHNDEAQGD